MLIHPHKQTSAIQRVGLTDAVDWRYIRGEKGEKGTVEGSPSTTIFAPTNQAWQHLPWKLKLFLFSPFGERVLTKLIQFHIAPDVILHSGMHLTFTAFHMVHILIKFSRLLT